MTIRKHQWVDLQRSDIDWDKSKPEEGFYEFEEKHYVSFQRQQSRPDHWLTWVRYYPDRREFDEFHYLRSTGYLPVKVGDELYWPEGLMPDENGYYTVGDLILVQYPLLRYVTEQIEMEAITSKGGKAKLEEIESQIAAKGGRLPDEVANQFFEGREVKPPEPKRIY